MWQMCFTFFKMIAFLTPLLGSENFLKGILLDDALCKNYEITIPGYESAHNPSIIPYKDGYLLSFRYIGRFPEWCKDTKLIGVSSFIGLAFLDKHFQIKKKSIQLLEIQSFSDDFSLYAEDARLLTLEDQIFVVFNDFPAPIPEYKRQLYLAEIIYENGRWSPKGKALPLILETMHRIEKNWSPFFVGQSLYFIYGEDPHIILSCDRSTGICKKVEEKFLNLDWPYGIIRGGTPALKVGNEFLTFYHSSLEKSDLYECRIYFMGAYTFDSSFPFTLRSFTPQPIGSKECYKDTSAKNHAAKKVIFPGGFVIEGNQIHIAWGKDDKKVMITTLDLEKLIQSMKRL